MWSTFAADYTATQAAPNPMFAPDCVTANATTVGACTLVRIQDGKMPFIPMAVGPSCTGNPTQDMAHAYCTTAAEQATIMQWIADGEPQ
jgi:hypothetical protein